MTTNLQRIKEDLRKSRNEANRNNYYYQQQQKSTEPSVSLISNTSQKNTKKKKKKKKKEHSVLTYEDSDEEDSSDEEEPWEHPDLSDKGATTHLDNIIGSIKEEKVVWDGGKTKKGKKSNENFFKWLDAYSSFSARDQRNADDNKIFGTV